MRSPTCFRIVALLARENLLNIDAELASKAQAEVSGEFIPSRQELIDTFVTSAECARTRSVANRRPMRSPIIELHGTRAGVTEVGDQLAKNPSLIWVRYLAVLVLGHCFGNDGDPR